MMTSSENNAQFRRLLGVQSASDQATFMDRMAPNFVAHLTGPGLPRWLRASILFMRSRRAACQKGWPARKLRGLWEPPRFLRVASLGAAKRRSHWESLTDGPAPADPVQS